MTLEEVILGVRGELFTHATGFYVTTQRRLTCNFWKTQVLFVEGYHFKNSRTAAEHKVHTFICTHLAFSVMYGAVEEISRGIFSGLSEYTFLCFNHFGKCILLVLFNLYYLFITLIFFKLLFLSVLRAGVCLLHLLCKRLTYNIHPYSLYPITYNS